MARMYATVFTNGSKQAFVSICEAPVLWYLLEKSNGGDCSVTFRKKNWIFFSVQFKIGF
jgi:hypothetical protein